MRNSFCVFLFIYLLDLHKHYNELVAIVGHLMAFLDMKALLVATINIQSLFELILEFNVIGFECFVAGYAILRAGGDEHHTFVCTPAMSDCHSG